MKLPQGLDLDQYIELTFMTGVPTKELETWFYQNEDLEK